MELRETIQKRQSIRRYKNQEVRQEDLLAILDTGRLAPSGKNCQNWQFIVIRDRALMEKIAQVTVAKNEEISSFMDLKDPERGQRFRKFVKNFTLFYLQAPVLLVVYSTTYYPSGYHELAFIDAPAEQLEDLLARGPGFQSLGAAMENISLAAVDLGYGTCWMTSQNYAAKEIESLLKQEIGFEKEGYSLACMLSIGVPEENQKSPPRKPLEEICTFVG